MEETIFFRGIIVAINTSDFPSSLQVRCHSTIMSFNGEETHGVCRTKDKPYFLKLDKKLCATLPLEERPELKILILAVQALSSKRTVLLTGKIEAPKEDMSFVVSPKITGISLEVP